MIRLIAWTALGYASCVWDCSCSPVHDRWPSATGVFILLLSMREPRHCVWAAAACGLVMDAGQGGPLGLRVLAGVLIATLTCATEIGKAETKWTRVALFVFLMSLGWLLVPRLAHFGSDGLSWGGAAWNQTLVMQAVSTTLVTLAIRSLLRPVAHKNEAPW